MFRRVRKLRKPKSGRPWLTRIRCRRTRVKTVSF
jgi:hypothetical protein